MNLKTYSAFWEVCVPTTIVLKNYDLKVSVQIWLLIVNEDNYLGAHHIRAADIETFSIVGDSVEKVSVVYVLYHSIKPFFVDASPKERVVSMRV